ncbi:MAG: lysoplasmalogenase [Leptospiraceae bacterium]|nr:lysoplasmalogenase [Leptospiraceae bacterium]
MLNRKSDIYILYLYTALAVLYIVLFRILDWHSTLNPWFKTLPIWILAAVALRRMPALPGGWALCAGILFGSAGDFILSSPELPNHFLLGLILFLVGHIFYVISFLHTFQWQNRAVIPLLLLSALVTALALYLFPRIPANLQIAVMAYIGVIFAMNGAALLRRSPWPAVIAGALCFLLSDSLIALQKFGDFNFSWPWVMLTYYPAQFLILFGSISDAELATLDSRATQG